MSAPAPRRIVVVGATSTIARLVVRRWVGGGASRVRLVGRDLVRLDAVAADLRVRAPAVEVDCVALDLADPAAVAAEVASSMERVMPEMVLIAHGAMHEQAQMQHDLALAADQLVATGVSPVLWLEGFADAMTAGTIVAIGSPAGDRGRARNYLYGSAKAMLEHAVQGLQHRAARSGGPRVVLVKPGPTRTRMTAGAGGRMTDPEDVAAGIVRAAMRARPVVYLPGVWRWIMLVVRALPRGVFHRTSF